MSITDDDDTAYTSNAPYMLLELPRLAKKIEGAAGYFMVDLINGSLFCVVARPGGEMELADINSCFKRGYKHVAPVLELIPGGKKDNE